MRNTYAHTTSRSNVRRGCGPVHSPLTPTSHVSISRLSSVRALHENMGQAAAVAYLQPRSAPARLWGHPGAILARRSRTLSFNRADVVGRKSIVRTCVFSYRGRRQFSDMSKLTSPAINVTVIIIFKSPFRLDALNLLSEMNELAQCLTCLKDVAILRYFKTYKVSLCTISGTYMQIRLFWTVSYHFANKRTNFRVINLLKNNHAQRLL